jgi:hypothetical protein
MSNDWCGDHEPLVPTTAPSMDALAAAMRPFLYAAAALERDDLDGSDDLVLLDVNDDDGVPVGISYAEFRALADAFMQMDP